MNPSITSEVNDLLLRMRAARRTNAADRPALLSNMMTINPKDIETLHAVLMMLDFAEAVLRKE